MYSNIKEQESSRQSVLENQKWVQSHKFDTSPENETRRKRYLQDQAQKIDTKCRELETSNQNLMTYMNNLTDLANWSQIRNQTQRSNIRKLFESIHQLLDEKERETYEAFEQIENNFQNLVTQQTNKLQDLQQENKDLIQKIKSTAENQEDNGIEKVRKLNQNLNKSSPYQSQQVNLVDYGITIESTLKSVQGLLESLRCNLNPNLFRWKITSNILKKLFF